jgi:hypothetical protein
LPARLKIADCPSNRFRIKYSAAAVELAKPNQFQADKAPARLVIDRVMSMSKMIQKVSGGRKDLEEVSVGEQQRHIYLKVRLSKISKFPPKTVSRAQLPPYLLFLKTLKPLEEKFLFSKFHAPPLEDADFSAKPMVLLIGQYSTGKTSFIKYLLGQDFPGIRIGPEPTTDKFNVVSHGCSRDELVIPGNALVVDEKMLFRPLAKVNN